MHTTRPTPTARMSTPVSAIISKTGSRKPSRSETTTRARDQDSTTCKRRSSHGEKSVFQFPLRTRCLAREPGAQQLGHKRSRERGLLGCGSLGRGEEED